MPKELLQKFSFFRNISKTKQYIEKMFHVIKLHYVSLFFFSLILLRISYRPIAGHLEGDHLAYIVTSGGTPCIQCLTLFDAFITYIFFITVFLIGYHTYLHEC